MGGVHHRADLKGGATTNEAGVEHPIPADPAMHLELEAVLLQEKDDKPKVTSYKAWEDAKMIPTDPAVSKGVDYFFLKNPHKLLDNRDHVRLSGVWTERAAENKPSLSLVTGQDWCQGTGVPQCCRQHHTAGYPDRGDRVMAKKKDVLTAKKVHCVLAKNKVFKQITLANDLVLEA